MEKPKLGAALLISEWFITTGGIDGSTNEEYSRLGKQIDEDVETILNLLGQYFDVVYPGLVYSVEKAKAAAKAFHENDIDALLYVHVMWSDDFPLIRIIQECGHYPSLLWYYNPFQRLPDVMTINDSFRGSGSVGFLQGSAPMKKMGFDFEFCFGTPNDIAVQQKLNDYAQALLLKRKMKECRVGEIGPRCECMTGTFTDEFKLLKTFGIEIVPISAYRLAQEAESIPEDKVTSFVEELKEKYRIDGVEDDALAYAARATLAVEKLVLDEDLDVVSMEDLNDEMHALLKTRPCLWTERLTERGTVVVMERDTISAVGMFVSSFLGGFPSMYGEIFTCDIEDNALVFGHAGMHNFRLAEGEISIIKDMEYYQSDETTGAWPKFHPKAGEVTMVSMFSDVDGYRILSFKGEVAAGVDKMPHGFQHAYIKCEKDLRYLYEEFGRNGLTQHFSMCRGDISEKLEVFCKLMKINYVKL